MCITGAEFLVEKFLTDRKPSILHNQQIIRHRNNYILHRTTVFSFPGFVLTPISIFLRVFFLYLKVFTFNNNNEIKKKNRASARDFRSTLQPSRPDNEVIFAGEYTRLRRSLYGFYFGFTIIFTHPFHHAHTCISAKTFFPFLWRRIQISAFVYTRRAKSFPYQAPLICLLSVYIYIYFFFQCCCYL